MKTYLIFLLIPVILLVFSTKHAQENVGLQKVQTLQQDIDSLVIGNKLIKEEIIKDINVFKQEVDSINIITKVFIDDMKSFKNDTVINTEVIDTTQKNNIKKKGWIKRTIDKIKNK